MPPQRAACKGDDQAPSEQGRADTRHNWAARELPCHSPKPRELEMLSCSSVGGTQPHACASGLTTRHVRPYCSPHVLILPVVSLVLWPLVPTSSASVLLIITSRYLLCYRKGENCNRKRVRKSFLCFFWNNEELFLTWWG